MRIFLLLDRYLPNPLSSARMFYDLATEMSRLGHTVTVITSDDSLRTAFDVTREGLVTVVRVKAGTIRQSSKVARAINEIRLSGVIWGAARQYFEKNPCDLVVYYSPTIFWGGLVNKLKALNRCGSYLVLRDLFPQWALDAGLIKRSSLPYWYFKRQELKLYETADIIGVQSPANLDYFLNSNLQGRYNLEVLFNWAKVAECSATPASVRENLGLQDKVIFMYGGNFGVAQDIDNVVRLAHNLRNEKNIHFLLVGDGSEYNRVEVEIKSRGMNNINLLPAVSHDEYQNILAACDVGVITLRRDLKTQNFPGKMLSYMELRKPMLASINPGNDLRKVIHEHDAGLVCDNGNDDLFCQYALKLACDKGLRHSMGGNAHKLLSKTFNVSVAAQQILGHFQ